MALTNIQREVCRVVAKQRIASGESYVAGGAARREVLACGEIRFYAGSIRGAFPQII